MSIKKLSDGKYHVDVRPQGRNGKRYRKKFDTKYEAMNYEKHLLATHHNKAWLDRPQDRRKLTDLIDLWWKFEGQSKKTSTTYLRILNQIDRELGHPKANQITHKLLSHYRAYHLDSGKSLTTFNRKIMCLSNVFTVLIDAHEYQNEHPIKGFKVKRPKSTNMHFLSHSEIEQLLLQLSGDSLKVAKICLATGARWGEAESLKGAHVINGKVTFVDTKNGTNRTVPISPELEKEVLTGTNGRLFKNCYQDFYSTQQKCNFDLPKGQASHVLRHTFASHFMMNGGNILALQKILGHATIQQTMTYAHFSPDYLLDAVRFNPLNNRN